MADTDKNMATLRDLLVCFASWEPAVCVLGNVRADDAFNAISAAMDAVTVARRASPAAVPEGALPPLPEPRARFNINGPDGHRIKGWTAEQMEAYARATVSADRAQQGEPVYQIESTLKDGLHWRDTNKQVYDEHYPEHRRIVYRAAIKVAVADAPKWGHAQGGATNDERRYYHKACDGRGCKGCEYMGSAPVIATKAAAPADAPADGLLDLIVAYGAACTCMNETARRDLMAEIKGKLSGAAPVPDTGIPTTIREIAELAWKLAACYPSVLPNMFCEGEPVGRKLVAACQAFASSRAPDTGIPTAGEDDQWIFDLAAKHESRGRELSGPITFSSTAIVEFTRDVEAELASRCRAQGGMTKDNDNFRAPVSSTPTSGAVEKAGWISVDDARKPDSGVTVLLYVRTLKHGLDDDLRPFHTEDAQVEMGEYRKGESAEMSYFDCYASPISDNDWITHWMPLPVGPSEAKAGEDA